MSTTLGPGPGLRTSTSPAGNTGHAPMRGWKQWDRFCVLLKSRLGPFDVLEWLARIIRDGSLRSTHCNSSAMGAPPVAWRDGRVEPRGRETYSLQYGDRLSGEPARLHAGDAACRLVAAASGRL